MKFAVLICCYKYMIRTKFESDWTHTSEITTNLLKRLITVVQFYTTYCLPSTGTIVNQSSWNFTWWIVANNRWRLQILNDIGHIGMNPQAI